MTAAKSPFARLRAAKPLRIMVLGQGGVGKSALVVRFITRRFIGEYDPTLEKMYTFNPTVDNEVIPLEILDTAGQPHTEPPVLLVGNKTDQIADRMVSFEDGQKRFADIGCVSFHEISVRENIEEVWDVFRDVVRRWRSLAKCPRLKRSTSEVPSQSSSSPSPNIPSQQEIGSGLIACICCGIDRRAAVGGGAVPRPGQHRRHPPLETSLAPTGPSKSLRGALARATHEHFDARLAHRQLKTHLLALEQHRQQDTPRRATRRTFQKFFFFKKPSEKY
ncbi:ras-like protein family member 11A isoform X3 [Neocloeon triangulifer]|uniref:ras-like protein family member 11A isoform X3 n=1 Tax=Neocloeon triangulifer TaxID=2078957 RepID=UPI00286F83ED|nr:ras-like protein family member 11A isoform X3 [Neocloeon triangulifer]